MPEIVEKTLMECTSNGSNKFYEVTLQKDGHIYTVVARWGTRKGTTFDRNLWKTEGGQFQEKYRGDSLAMAQREKNKIVRSKRGQYKEIDAPKTKTSKKQPEKLREKTMEEASLERFSNLDF